MAAATASVSAGCGSPQARAIDDIPACDGAAMLRALVRAESERLVPQETVRDVALAA